MRNEGSCEAGVNVASLTDKLQLTHSIADALQAVGRLRTSGIPDVAVGQLWRAEWDDVTVLGTVLDIDEGYADFAPVSVDIEYADSYTMVVAQVKNPLPVSVAVFISMTIPVPQYTLQGYLGDFDSDTVAMFKTIWRSYRTGQPCDSYGSKTRAEADSLEARRDFRREMANNLGVLAAADLRFDRLIAEAVKPISDILKDFEIQPTGLSEILGIDVSDAMAIARGNVPMEFEQAESLSSKLGGIDPQLLMESVRPISNGLRQALHSPAGFAGVRRVAKENNVPYVRAIYLISGSYAARDDGSVDRDESAKFWEDILRSVAAGSSSATK